MKLTSTTAALMAAAVLGTAGAAWAAPEVSGVTMAQIPHTQWVQINYELGGEDAIVTLSIETNGVAIPDSAVLRLSGDVCKKVEQGSRSILWHAGADWPENVTAQAKARVTAWHVDSPPQVMVVDLTGGQSALAYPVFYYTSIDALPYGGVTSSRYKADYLVMRKILAGGFYMGEAIAPKWITLSKDIYAGVYEVTQKQWYSVMGGLRVPYFLDSPSRGFRPMELISYYDIREDGISEKPINPNWPQTNAVHATSFMGLLKLKTGLAGFDLPTEAQWEYVCRAGTVTPFNDGDEDANVSGANAGTNAWLTALGRYSFNGGLVNGVTPPAQLLGPANGSTIVGSFAPNAWGLYDMHGNVCEWCLDWWGSYPSAGSGVDPVGPASHSNLLRVFKGGSWNNPPADCRSTSRAYNGANNRWSSKVGFRLFRTMP